MVGRVIPNAPPKWMPEPREVVQTGRWNEEPGNAVYWRNKYYHFKDDEDAESKVFSGQYAGFIKDYEWNEE